MEAQCSRKVSSQEKSKQFAYPAKCRCASLHTHVTALPFACPIESVQDFLIKLGIKPLKHILEISTFSLDNVIVRLTNIMNRADKNWAHF